jgi:exosome complex component RRP4
MSKSREIVIPGEKIDNSKNVRSGYGTYEEDGKIFSKLVGIPKKSGEFISVIPLSGVYVPSRNDKIIGFVTDTEKFGWLADINSPWNGFLSVSEGVDDFIDPKKTNLNRYFRDGDVIYTQVKDVRGGGDVQLTMKTSIARKLRNGVLVKITPSKVPRLIGKEGSMVNMIKEKTKTIICVGQNGVVWICGEDVRKAIRAIKMIDEKSHVFGLTDEISKLLS